MSRIGKKPIELPKGVTADLKQGAITIKGPKGALSREIPPNVEVKVDGSTIVVGKAGESRKHGAFQGLARALLANMVRGVSAGYERKMQIEGVGYRVALQGKKLVFNLGYSHQVEFDLPKGIEAQVGEKGLLFSISGVDKDLVGQTAATIRGFKPPEPYKGKGIRYVDEKVRRKAGKAGVK